MRLGAGLLGLAALSAPAQSPKSLPWELEPRLPWQPSVPAEAPALEPDPTEAPLKVTLTVDGTLTVSDAQGTHLLKVGLPGRPLRIWRDGGVPLKAAGTWFFAKQTPLSAGLGGLQWGSKDLRPSLRGLLWVVDDSEDILTVIHPSAARVVYLPLPSSGDAQVSFLPDRLQATYPNGACWALPWLALLPQFNRLAPPPVEPPKGTALSPYPK